MNTNNLSTENVNSNDKLDNVNNENIIDTKINLSNFFNLTSNEINVKSLPVECINDYLNDMILITTKLKDLFYNSSNYKFKAPLEDILDTKTDFCKFLEELLNFFLALKKKFLLQHKGINAVSLSIDPTESGFPHLTDLWNFKKDCEIATKQLNSLPKVEEILKEAIDKLFNLEFPIREQLSYAKYNYFSFIKSNLNNIISDFKIYPIELIGSKDDENLYKLIFYGFDECRNIFHFYSLLLTQDKYAVNNLQKYYDHPFYNEIKSYYKQDVFKFAYHLDNVDPSIHPKFLLRYTLGPYYSPNTINSDAINKLLELELKHPFIFKFNASGVISIKTIKESSIIKSFYNKLFGYANSREIFSDKFDINYLIVPFSIKQYLKDKDEAGNPSLIFGLLEGGELVE